MVGDLNRNMDKRDRGRPGAAAHIGILALQGDFQAHGKTLDRLGWAWIEVRRAADLDGLRGLVLPGGESTTMRRLMEGSGLDVALQQFAAGGGAVYGTCAGAILLAQRVTNPSGHGLGVVDGELRASGAAGRPQFTRDRSRAHPSAADRARRPGRHRACVDRQRSGLGGGGPDQRHDVPS
jgi:putative intracellular protease/amidase